MNSVLCIPTLNPGKYAEEQVNAIIRQTTKVDSIIVLDSESNDGSIEEFKRVDARMFTIKRSEFNHGATRQKIVSIAPNADVYVFLTQDAIPKNKYAFEYLLSAFDNPNIGAAYGRQIPNINASSIEAHARLFNYNDSACVKDKSSIQHYGIKTAFISNSFAAYRKKPLVEVGGFPNNIIFGEDMYVGAKMILANWKIAYQASAQVYHSHNYTLIQEFQRYFDVGVFHALEPWIRDQFGAAEGEGRKFLVSELKYLWKENSMRIPESILRTFIKYSGYRIGKIHGFLPTYVNTVLSMNNRYWKNEYRKT